MKEQTIGSADEASLSIETLLGTMEGHSFTGDFEGRVKKKALETDASLHRGPLGNLGSPLTGNFSRRVPEREHLSLRELLGGSFLRTRKDVGRRAQGMDSILRGGPAGEFSRGVVYRALQGLWRQAPFSIGALLSIMGSPFTGNSER
jgi:hypothetical protein